MCTAAFVLDDRVRTIIAALKYRRQRRLARWFASQTSALIPRAADAITWLPATPERRRSRGFDQSEELARSLARITGVPVVPLLTRSASDRRQTGQSRSERLGGPDLLAPRPSPPFVVVVDDVITTGSSLRVAAAALRGAGAQRIVGVAMAVTPLRARVLSPRLDD